MATNGWLQITVYFLVVLTLTKPLGVYLFRVFEDKDPPFSGALRPAERFLYRLGGVDPEKEQD